jgi:hypothetical protein
MIQRTILPAHAADNTAILIDARSLSAEDVPHLLGASFDFGQAVVKRAYGNFADDAMKPWQEILSMYGIEAMHRPNHDVATSLIIDAMDLLHEAQADIEAFCLVSSADLSGLATRLRRKCPTQIYGVGQQDAPPAFIRACDSFLFANYLGALDEAPALSPERAQILQTSLSAAIQATAREDGWAPLPWVSHWGRKADPAFLARNFGFANWLNLAKAQPYLEIRSEGVEPGMSSMQHHAVKLRH